MIRVLSMTTGKLSQAHDSPPRTEVSPFGVFGPDGQRVYLIGAARTAARFVGAGNPEATYEVGQERPNPFVPRPTRAGRPTCMAVSADETTVAVGARAGNLYVYTAPTGKPTHEFHFTECIRALAFSTHGRVLAVALDDGSVVLVPIKP
jgi:hypothetical protein